MHKISLWLLQKPKNNTASSFMWNMVGSMSLAIGTMILTILVNRIVGDYAGGDFAMALATGQLMATIGYFEIRTYQVTDTNKEFSFNDYYATRLITNLLMILASIIYIIVKGYTLQKTWLVFLLCIYKMLDTYADVFEGEFQQNDRLDISGKSLTLRTVFSIVVLVIVLCFSKNMYISVGMAIFTSMMIIYITNIRIIHQFSKFKVNFQISTIKKILLACLPLFVSAFMSTYILNASRYAIEAYLPSNFHSKYTAIFLPVSTINLLVGFIFKPMLTSMARKWNEGKYHEFIKVIGRVLFGVGVVTIFVLIGAYFIGIPILSFLYGTELEGFKIPLLILLIGGGLNSANVILYYALSVIRRQNLILIAYLVTFVASLFIPNILTGKYLVMGAAWSFVMMMFILFIISIFFVYMSLKEESRKGY